MGQPWLRKIALDYPNNTAMQRYQSYAIGPCVTAQIIPLGRKRGLPRRRPGRRP